MEFEPLGIRCCGGSDIAFIRRLRKRNPSWSRYRLSRELAAEWNWVNDNGQIKDMACRSLLLKLADRNVIELPALRRRSPNRYRCHSVGDMDHNRKEIDAELRSLQPLRFADISASETNKLFTFFLERYHYLGYRQSVGETLRYPICANDGRPLACFLFGSAAWKCAARDRFIAAGAMSNG